jgi:hypothetical protein|nr:MAG TPA: hypothetical protein [Caudoviricetes sp.]
MGVSLSLHRSILAYVRKLPETGSGWYRKGRLLIATRCFLSERWKYHDIEMQTRRGKC